MNLASQCAQELQVLRSLCDEASPRAVRRNLLESLSPQFFQEPEHRVVFDSIRALFSRGDFSAPQLRVHLNNRGFPDTDVDKYFQRAPIESADRP